MDKLASMNIIVKHGDTNTPIKIQKLLSSYSSIIIGRLGIPDKESNCNIISLILKGEENDILALKEKLNTLSINCSFCFIN